MGVKGLLIALKGVQRQRHLSEYSNSRIAVDGFAWLHRAAFAALHESVHGQISDRPVKFCIKRARMMLANGVTPLFVFDGKPLPSKAGTNQARRDARIAAKSESDRLMAEGDAKGAYKMMGQAVSISWDMVVHLMKALKAEGIDYLVAPYEADAQLGYLSQQGIVRAVISEDSDLLLYGCKEVLFKMDDAGQCLSIRAEDLPRAHLLPPDSFSEESLIVLCALAGCDYIDGVHGVGLKKGARFVARTISQEVDKENINENVPPSPSKRLARLALELRAAGYTVPDDYGVDLKRALWTFKHQTVFDPTTKKLTRRYPLPDNVSLDLLQPTKTLEYLGPPIDAHQIAAMCNGEIDPRHMKPTGLAEIEAGKIALARTKKAPSLNQKTLQYLREDKSNEKVIEAVPKRSRFSAKLAETKSLLVKKKRKIDQDILTPPKMNNDVIRALEKMRHRSPSLGLFRVSSRSPQKRKSSGRSPTLIRDTPTHSSTHTHTSPHTHSSAHRLKRSDKTSLSPMVVCSPRPPSCKMPGMRRKTNSIMGSSFGAMLDAFKHR